MESASLTGFVWTREQLESLCRGVLRGLRIDKLSDIDRIGGAASLAVTSGGVVVKTLSFTHGAERFLHFVGVHGALDGADALALADAVARMLGVTAQAELKDQPLRATLLIRCDAATEYLLQERVSALEARASLADALSAAMSVH